MGGLGIFQIAVCDANSRQLVSAVRLLEKFSLCRPCIDMRIKSFDSGDKLISALMEGVSFGLFLLGIPDSGIEGINLARRLRALSADAALILIANTTDYAYDAFDVSASHYILKPVTEQKLFPVLDKITGAVKHFSDDFIMVSATNCVTKVFFSSILYVELINRAMIFHLDNGRSLKSKTIRTPFSEAVTPLLADGRFLCAHKSFVLNMEKVETLTGKAFIMENGAELPIPRYRYAEVKLKYFEWLSVSGIGLLGVSTHKGKKDI